MMLFKKKNNTGFTLIELLVVIAIITLFATVVIVMLSVSRKKSRDARRFRDLHEIQTALDLYYGDIRRYPIVATQGDIATVLTAAIVPAYMAALPPDPSGGSYSYQYVSSNNGQYYCIGSIVEVTGPPSTCSSSQLGSVLNNVNYAVGP